eukprot:385286_1
MTVNGQFLDKTDPTQFGEILSSTNPPDKGPIIIKIIETPIPNEAQIQFIIAYTSRTEIILSNSMHLTTTEEKDWNNNFTILKNEIELKFPLLQDKEYEIQDEGERDVGPSELQEFYSNGHTKIVLKIIYHSNKQYNKQPPKIPKQIKINYNRGSLLWIPPIPVSDSDGEYWEYNYNNFIATIEFKYNIHKNDIKAIQDANQCEIKGGDELKIVWNELINDDNLQITKITIISRSEEVDNIINESDIDQEVLQEIEGIQITGFYELDPNEEAENIINGMNENEINAMVNVLKDKSTESNPNEEVDDIKNEMNENDVDEILQEITDEQIRQEIEGYQITIGDLDDMFGDDNVHSTLDAAVITLSDHDITLIRMRNETVLNNEGQYNLDADEFIIGNESDDGDKTTKQDYSLSQFCDGIGIYYAKMNSAGYYDAVRKGKFSKWFHENDLKVDFMEEELMNSNVDHCRYLDFDYNDDNKTNLFPVPTYINTADRIRKKQFQIMQHVYKKGYGEPPCFEFKLSWKHVSNAIKHSLYKMIAISFLEMTTSDLICSPQTIDNVLTALVAKVKINQNEVKYIEQLTKRAFKFQPAKNEHSIMPYKYVGVEDDTKSDLNFGIVRDIYNVYDCFLFSNYQFIDYTKTEFILDIQKNVPFDCNDEQVTRVQQINTLVATMEKYNFYPRYIINDDMYEIWKYFFSVSHIIHKMRQTKNNFKVKVYVIPQSVVSIYDNTLEHRISITNLHNYLFSNNCAECIIIKPSKFSDVSSM